MRPTTSDVAEILAQSPAPFQKIFLHADASAGFRGTITSADAVHLVQQLGVTVDQLMLNLVPLAALYAQPVISNFKVGAVAQGISGQLYYRANIEFKSAALRFPV